MSRVEEKLEQLEDQVMLLQEEANANKLKVVRLERQLKERQGKRDESPSHCQCGFSLEEARTMRRKVTRLEEKTKEVVTKTGSLTKLQHILGGLVIKAQKSFDVNLEIAKLQSELKKINQDIIAIQDSSVKSDQIKDLQAELESINRDVAALKPLPPKQKQAKVLPLPPPLKKSSSATSNRKPSLYCSAISREMEVMHTDAILTYAGSPKSLPVAQFISAQPLTATCSSFSLYIVNTGLRGCIAIGVCPKTYRPDRQPGWDGESAAYHADDGGIYISSGSPTTVKEPCTKGDTMKCVIDFTKPSLTFFKNDVLMHTFGLRRSALGKLHAAVGMHSVGEAIKLLEKEPWRA